MSQFPFTWTDGRGKAHDVLPDWDVDQWTGREVRELERLGLLGAGTGRHTTTMAVLAVAVARQLDGYTIAAAYDEMTLGKIDAAMSEMREKARAADAERAAAKVQPEPTGNAVDFTGSVVLQPVVEDGAGEVLSPTNDAGDSSSAPA